MKNRRISRGFAALLLGFGIVSVSFGQTLSKQTSSTPISSPGDKLSQETAPASAEIRPGSFLANPLDLERLTNKADLIIIGRVSAISNAAQATLSIDKVVKGEVAAQTIDFQFFPNLPSACERIQPDLFAMFFLKRNEVGNGYQILDPTYPAVIAPTNPVLMNEPGLDRTVDIVGQVLLSGRSVEDRRVAVNVLRSAQTDRATQLLGQSAKDNDVVVKMQSFSALVNRNDLQTLAIAEQILLNPPAGPDQYLLDNISAALEGIKDPQAIPALQRLLRSSNTRTRLGAVSALRQMHTVEAVDGLVIALGDTNRDVRYEAVIGLAELTGQNEWAPSIGTFEQEEQRYLDHWKEWSRTR
jgi:hypothetical protein